MSRSDWTREEPLEEITCRSTDCSSGLHCFRRYRPKKEKGETARNVVCNQCGANLIDWNRLDKKDLNDVKYTFEALTKEMVRHHYWHVEIDELAKKKAQSLGSVKLREWVRLRLNSKLAPPSKDIFRDGTQTPKSGNIVFYAQHSTSTCCRKCLEEWYGIDRNRSLKPEEEDYFIELIMLYIHHRLPELTQSGEQTSLDEAHSQGRT